MGKIVGQTRFFSLGEATSLEEGKTEFKPVKPRLKIDLVSYPARAEGSVNMDIIGPYGRILSWYYKRSSFSLQVSFS